MIKLQDFARECGVTDRAIQKHLQRHAAVLDHHVERRGKNGTWLDQEACDYIRARMIQQPIVIGDASQAREVEALRKELDKTKSALIEAQRFALDAQTAIAEASAARLALAAAEKEKEDLLAAKEAEIQEAAQKLDKATQEAQEAHDRARVAQEHSEQLEAALEAQKAHSEALMHRGLWARILNKGID